MTSAPAARRRPPGRYDEPARVGQKVTAVVLGCIFLGLVAAAAYAFWVRFSRDEVRVQVVGYAVQGDDAVRVDFTVETPDERVWCLVRSRNEAGQEVGREFVAVDPDPDGTVRVQHLLTTTDVPVTGEVTRCLPVDPPAGEPTAVPAQGSGDQADP